MMATARISFLADCKLTLPDWADGETDQQKLDTWIQDATDEPLEALRCVDAKFIIVGYLVEEVKK